MGVTVKQEHVFSEGDRVVLDNDGIPYDQVKPGTIGTVFIGNIDPFAGEDSYKLVWVRFDNGVKTALFAFRVRHVDAPTGPWPLEFREKFVLAERLYGEPHLKAGAVVEVRTPDETDPWGGVGVALVETGERFRVHWSRLYTPVEVESEATSR